MFVITFTNKFLTLFLTLSFKETQFSGFGDYDCMSFFVCVGEMGKVRGRDSVQKSKSVNMVHDAEQQEWLQKARD